MKVTRELCYYRMDGDGTLIHKANKYFETCEVYNMAYGTVGTYAYCLLQFFRWYGADLEKFESFTQKDLQDFLFHLKKGSLNPRSINQRLCCVRAFFRFCFGKNIPHAAGVLYPKAHYRGQRKNYIGYSRQERKQFLELRVKVPKRVMDPLTPPEIDDFLRDIVRYRDLAIVLTMLLCGLRRQEIVNIRIEDVDFHQSALRVRGKGRKERMVPMPFHLMQVFEKYLAVERPLNACQQFFVVLQGGKIGQEMSVIGIRSLFRKRRERLGLPKAKPHQFRHAFASDLARVGVPLTTIQKLLGHSGPEMSILYIELFFEDIREHYEKAMKRIGERYAALST